MHIVRYSSCWGYSLINTFKLKKKVLLTVENKKILSHICLHTNTEMSKETLVNWQRVPSLSCLFWHKHKHSHTFTHAFTHLQTLPEVSSTHTWSRSNKHTQEYLPQPRYSLRHRHHDRYQAVAVTEVFYIGQKHFHILRPRVFRRTWFG